MRRKTTFLQLPVVALAALAIFAATLADKAAASQDDAKNFARMSANAEARNWGRAELHAAKVSDPVANDTLEWLRLRSGQAEWSEYREFLSRNGDWPGLKLLRKAGERSIPEGAHPDHVIRYFETQPPQTGAGAIRLASALRRVGRVSEANETIAECWLALPFTKDQQKDALAKFKAQLRSLHAERIDNAVWEGRNKEAARMLPLVDSAYRKLVQARIKLRMNAKNTTDILNSIPRNLRDDPGLAYERFLWRLRNGLGDSAVELLLERSSSAGSLGKPEHWANNRLKIARSKMREGNSKLAYRLASSHHLVEGSDFADLEWLSGYIALRKLGQPKRAVMHFQRFREEVESHVSYGRAGYWLGRAYQASGDTEAARNAYKFAANFQTTFYGQLAAEKIGTFPDQVLIDKAQFPNWRKAKFRNDRVVRAAFLYNEAGNASYAAWFLAHRAETMNRVEIAQLSQMAQDKGADFAAIKVAKQGLKQGDLLVDYLYPLTGIEKFDLAVPPEVAISIVRQESEFNRRAHSPSGARGLMQLMPNTATEVARKFGVSGSTKNLLVKDKTNVQLGSLYLRERIKSFDGSYVLAVASYNAGPARVRRWMSQFGDPRKPGNSTIDWIEHIPYNETRNYVMRVLEALTVYRMRIRGSSHSRPITDFLS
ncbi:MAG: lytic transglycosylase domain-containing protein [Albidovulum sp.]|nr:lytic transglycosylase domain-containing protein [Albidovulum sp.]